MPIYSTDYTNSTINSTGFTGPRNNESITIGSPIGLSLLLTQAQSVDTPTYDYSTDYKDKWSYILANSIVITAGDTDYDARGLLVGTNTTYSTNWSET